MAESIIGGEEPSVSPVPAGMFPLLTRSEKGYRRGRGSTDSPAVLYVADNAPLSSLVALIEAKASTLNSMLVAWAVTGQDSEVSAGELAGCLMPLSDELESLVEILSQLARKGGAA